MIYPIQYQLMIRIPGLTTHLTITQLVVILKLDILGHDVPTIIKNLEDITGIDPTKIPLDEKRTMKLFSSTEPRDSEEDIDCKVGTLGIPEFGTSS